MSKGIVTRFTGTLSLLLLSLIKGYPQDVNTYPVRLMFYNVENLFDIYNDSLTDDDEFLPAGVRRWNYQRYEKKLNSLHKVIIAAGEWNPPALVGFCEIENRKVLEDLVFGTNLSKYNYGIIHEDSPDSRGIDVCLIYRKDYVNILDYKYFIPPVSGDEKFLTRSVLYLKCTLLKDTIHLFVNHWPSRRGGVLAGESQRLKIAEMVKNKTDSIASCSNGKAGIIIIGDFNSTPDDQTLNLLSGKLKSGLSMINLSAGLPAGSGTYRYMGTWEMIDQVIISDVFIEGKSGLSTGPGMLRIFQPDFLLQNDPKYPGQSPNSTYRGYKYQGGFSDHLPILLDLKIK
ncbi:MAG: endonuclease [Bacteroidia bacterium]|nr:endonuclease [Bacteroidia bacterium]